MEEPPPGVVAGAVVVGVTGWWRCGAGWPSGVLAGEYGLQGGVLGGVVGGAVLPAPPDDVDPGAGGDADGVGVVFAAVAGVSVEGGGPGAGVAGAVGEVAPGVAEVAVDVPAEAVAEVAAGAAGDGGDAGDAGQGGGVGVAGAAVAGLGEQPGGAQDAGPGQGGEDVRVGVGVQLGGDLAFQGLDPGGQVGHGAGQLDGEGGLGGVVAAAGRGGGQPGCQHAGRDGPAAAREGGQPRGDRLLIEPSGGPPGPERGQERQRQREIGRAHV